MFQSCKFSIYGGFDLTCSKTEYLHSLSPSNFYALFGQAEQAETVLAGNLGYWSFGLCGIHVVYTLL